MTIGLNRLSSCAHLLCYTGLFICLISSERFYRIAVSRRRNLDKFFFSQESYSDAKTLTLNFMAPLYGWASAVSRLQRHYKETVYFLPLSPQEVLILIGSNSEWWEAELTLEPPSGFELGPLGLGIEHPNQ